MNKKLSKLLHRTASDDRGNVAIQFAALVIPAVMLIGGGVDIGRAFQAKLELQSAADAAALAGASMVEATDASRVDAAQKVFLANTASLTTAQAQASVSNGTVTVTATGSVSNSFLQIMNLAKFDLDASSAAKNGYEVSPGSSDLGKACLIALDPNSDVGLHIQGDNDLKFESCWSYSNSTKPTAINANGSQATAVGEGHCAVGGLDIPHNNYSPAPRAQCVAIADPFATVSAYDPVQAYQSTFTAPSIPSSCKSDKLNLKKGTFTLEPGRYCGGISLQAQAKVTLLPGIYFIDNGTLNVQSGSTLQGENVLIYLTGANAKIQLIGGGTVNLKGRQVGSSYTSFLVIQHPNANRNGVSNIQGGGSFNLEGVIYMPTQQIEVAGNGDVNGDTRYFGMIAKDFYFRGNGKFYLKTKDGVFPTTYTEIMPDVPRQERQDARLVQ